MRVKSQQVINQHLTSAVEDVLLFPARRYQLPNPHQSPEEPEMKPKTGCRADQGLRQKKKGKTTKTQSAFSDGKTRLRWHHHQDVIKHPVARLTDWNQGTRSDGAGENVHL